MNSVAYAPRPATPRPFAQIKKAWRTHAFEYLILLCMMIQLALGAPLGSTILIHLGTMIGFYAARLAGGFSSVGGLLIAWYTLGTTGAALIVKTCVLENWASRVTQPVEVSAVYFVGYLSVLAAAVIYREVPVYTWPRTQMPARGWCILSIGLFLVCSTLPYVVGYRTGGLWGALHLYTRLAPCSVVAALAASVLWHPHRKFWHPLPLAILGLCLMLAVVGIGKEGFVSSGLAFVLALLMFRRISLRQFAMLLLAGFLVLVTIVGPYSDTVRFEAAGKMGGWARAQAAYTAIWQMFDPEVRARAKAKVRYEQDRERKTRFTDAKVGYLERLMTIASGKELIQATVQKGQVGWGVIISDLTAQLPRFLNPDKGLVSSNYFYARYSGIISADWLEHIGISFGPFPTFYAGGGLFAVAIMSTFGFGVVFLIIKSIECQFPGPVSQCMIFMVLWHYLVESGSPIENMYVLLFLYLTLFAAAQKLGISPIARPNGGAMR